MNITSIDFKNFFSKRNIIIMVSAALVLALTLTLVFCTKKNEDEQQGDGDQTGQVTPDNGTPDNGGDTTDTPDDGNIPEQPEHTHSFVDGKCECGESDPNYVPEPVYITYEEYQAMTPAEKDEYYATFPDFFAFLEWRNAAKAEYDKENAGNGPTLGEDGSIDVGDIFGD